MLKLTRVPSSPGPLYQNEVKCPAFDMEMSFILTQIKLISTGKVVHLASIWKWGFLELGSGLLSYIRKGFNISQARL